MTTMNTRYPRQNTNALEVPLVDVADYVRLLFLYSC